MRIPISATTRRAERRGNPATSGRTETHPEGLFFPDTYLFDKGSQRSGHPPPRLPGHAAATGAAWAGATATLPFKTPYEVLIMASIVEKETGLLRTGRRSPRSSSIACARGMLLQTDPTVIYGLGERFDGNLREERPHRPTRPRTPIPGAVCRQRRSPCPAWPRCRPRCSRRPSDMLYFVARGDGSSEFSRTLDEHNRAVAKYQKARGA